MAVRASMADIITRLRGLVGDPNTGDPSLAAFTDEQLQQFLDERRTDVIEARLQGFLAGNIYTDFKAPHGWWEDSVVLIDGSGETITPDASDLVVGRWTITDGASIPVFISGSFYDLYGSAQAVCEAWAAKVAREFDFATDQQKFDRTGKREGLLLVAREFARKAVPPGRMPAWRSSDW